MKASPIKALHQALACRGLDYTEKMTPYRTSMKIDYDERRSLEVEAIFTELTAFPYSKGC